MKSPTKSTKICPSIYHVCDMGAKRRQSITVFAFIWEFALRVTRGFHHSAMSANACEGSEYNLGIINEFRGLQMNFREWAKSQIQYLWIVRIDYIQTNSCIKARRRYAATTVLVSGHEVVVGTYGFLLQLPVPYCCPQLDPQLLWLLYWWCDPNLYSWRFWVLNCSVFLVAIVFLNL